MSRKAIGPSQPEQTGGEIVPAGLSREVEAFSSFFADVPEVYGAEQPVLSMTIEPAPLASEVRPRRIIPDYLLGALGGVTCRVAEVVDESDGTQWAVVKLMALADALFHAPAAEDNSRRDAAIWVGGYAHATMEANPHWRSRGGPEMDILLTDGRTVDTAA